jgi:hypothetical protein
MINESDARRTWNGWTEIQRRAFLEGYEFNTSIARYSWPMLPYPVQQLMMQDKHSVTRGPIIGKCAKCGNVYALDTEEIVCPQCEFKGVLWAYEGNPADPEDETLEYMRDQLGTPELSEGDKLDITELKRIYELEDPR